MSTTLWSQATETVSSSGAGNAGTVGLHFTVSSACTLGGLWLYSKAGESLTQLPTTIGLYNYSTQALITSQTPSWSGAAGSGWVFAAFTSPPSLASGTDYMAAVFRNDAVNGWFCYNSAYTWPVTVSPVTAPKDTGAGQGWFNNTSTTALIFPGSQDAGFNWWLDVSVSSGTAHTATAALTVTPSAAASARHGHGATAALTVTPSVSAAGHHPRTAAAALTVTPGTAAAGHHPRTASASLSVTPAPAAGAESVPPYALQAEDGTALLAEDGSYLETEDAPGGTPASLTVTPGMSAAAAHGHSAAASLAVTPSPSAEREHGATAGASLAVTPSESAGAGHGHPASAALSVAPSVSAAGEAGRPHAAAASLTVTPGTSAAAAHGHSAAASLAVAPSVSAAGHVSVPHSATASLAVTPVTAATAPAPFPGSPLDLQCQLSLGGTWTDVSSYAYQRAGETPPVSITRGRPDESSQANPSTCSWEWNNRDGRFSPKNPLSPYYGLLGRNTPVRWSVPAAAPYLRTEADLASGASCPDAARLRVSGDLDVRVDLRLTDWQGTGSGLDLLGANWTSLTAAGWMLGTSALQTGLLVLNWTTNGTARQFARSTVPVPAGRNVLRATLAVATGTVTFYTAAAGGIAGGTWTQLGDVVVTGATTLFAASGGLQIGGAIEGSGFYGQLHAAMVLSGIGGTVEAYPDFGAQPAGTTSFADPQGNTWALSGTAEVSGRDYRFHGEMSALPPKWDVTGRDMRVMAQAGGPLRRLSQGTSNAMSAMKRAILLQSGDLAPVAYWPMEDAAGASQFGAALGPLPMTFDHVPAPALATDSSFLASAPLPSLNGSRVAGNVAPYTGTGTWTVRFLLKVSPPSADATLIRIVAPGGACPVVYVNVDTGGNLEFLGYAPDGSEAFNTGYAAFGADGNPLWVSVEAQPDGASTQYSLVALVPGASSGGEVTGTASGASGNVSQVGIDPTGAFTGTVIGHVQVQSAWASLFTLGQPLNAWQGETAAARYARLAGENGYPVRIIGAPAASAMMGAQGQATLSALLAEVEAADLGQQFEPRQVLALGYRTLASMCGQAPALALDYSQSQPGGVSGDGDSGLDPTYDDALTANDWTVTRGAASGNQGATWQSQLHDGSAMSVSPPPAGVGDYAKTATVNVEGDAQLPDTGGWMVHIGSLDEARWPVIPVNLARPETAALRQAAAGVDVGDYVQVLNVPDQVLYDPVRQLALGVKESLGGFHWTLEFNAVPEAAYETGIYDDPVYGRADTDGSALASAVTSAATVLSVTTTGPSGILWTTAAADFPFDIAAGGERMTVTNVTGSSSPQSFTVTRSVNGVVKSQAAGADVRLWFPPVYSLA